MIVPSMQVSLATVLLALAAVGPAAAGAGDLRVAQLSGKEQIPGGVENTPTAPSSAPAVAAPPSAARPRPAPARSRDR